MNYIRKIKDLFSGSKEVQASTAYFICSLIQKGLSLLTLPIFARILTEEEIGVSVVYSTCMAIVIIFTTLNLPYGSFPKAMLKFENDREGYISAVNTLCVILTIVYFILYIPFRGFWNDLADLSTGLMLLLGLEMLTSTSTQFWMGRARFEYRYKPFLAVTLLTTVLGTAVALLAVVFLPNKGELKVMAYGFVVSIIGTVFLIRSILKGKQCLNKTYLKYALSFNIPLIPYYLSQIIFNQSDKLMINSMKGMGDAGLYGVAYSVALVLTFVLNAINNSFVPWLYRKLKAGQLHENKQISVIIALGMAVLLLGVISLGPEIMLIMGGGKYEPAQWVIPPVSMSLLLLFFSQLFINIEFYFEQKYKLVGASIIAAVVNIVLNYYGINEFGFVAAGYTTLISYILFAVCNYLAMNKICKDKGIKESIYDYKILVIIAVVFMGIGFLLTALYPYRLIRFGVILLALVMIYLFREKIISIFKKTWATMKG